jgi:putative phosphoesterase
MTKIGLISDTHGWLDPEIFKHFADCNEIWHAGDFGSMEVVQQLAAFKPLKGVYGNIDEPAIRQRFPEILKWKCEEVEVLMTHIGGYPGKYSPQIKKDITLNAPDLFISGHSHILKVIFDDKLKCLHINPGAAGKQGWHKVKTIITFLVEGKLMKDCKVIELGRR